MAFEKIWYDGCRQNQSKNHATNTGTSEGYDQIGHMNTQIGLNLSHIYTMMMIHEKMGLYIWNVPAEAAFSELDIIDHNLWKNFLNHLN